MEADLAVAQTAWTGVAGTARLLAVREVRLVDAVAAAARGGKKQKHRSLDA